MHVYVSQVPARAFGIPQFYGRCFISLALDDESTVALSNVTKKGKTRLLKMCDCEHLS